MKILQLIYIAIWLSVGLLTLMFETGFLTEGFFDNSPAFSYIVSIVFIVTAVGGSWLACRLLAISHIKKEMENDTSGFAQKKWTAIRLSITALAIYPSLISYYGLPGTTPLYCLFIALTASLLCMPKT